MLGTDHRFYQTSLIQTALHGYSEIFACESFLIESNRLPKVGNER